MATPSSSRRPSLPSNSSALAATPPHSQRDRSPPSQRRARPTTPPHAERKPSQGTQPSCWPSTPPHAKRRSSEDTPTRQALDRISKTSAAARLQRFVEIAVAEDMNEHSTSNNFSRMLSNADDILHHNSALLEAAMEEMRALAGSRTAKPPHLDELRRAELVLLLGNSALREIRQMELALLEYSDPDCRE